MRITGLVLAGLLAAAVFGANEGRVHPARVQPGLKSESVVALVIDPESPTTIYAGAIGFKEGRRGGLYRSVDGGRSWSAADEGLASNYVFAIAIDPSNPTTLYAGTWRSGLFRSTDGARSWNPASTGLIPHERRPILEDRSISVDAIAIDPVSPATVYAGTPAGVFKSTDHATTWRRASAGLPDDTAALLEINPTTPTMVYAGITRHGIFRTTDGAQSWSPASNRMTETVFSALVIDQDSPATLYVAAFETVFKSTDGALTWTPASKGLTPTGFRAWLNEKLWVSQDVEALAIDPSKPSTLYAGTTHGLFRTTDGATTWRRLNRLVIQALAIDPSTPTTIYAGTPSGVLKSTNGGLDWSTGR